MDVDLLNEVISAGDLNTTMADHIKTYFTEANETDQLRQDIWMSSKFKGLYDTLEIQLRNIYS